MSVRQQQELFTSDLREVYSKTEAGNIFHLIRQYWNDHQKNERLDNRSFDDFLAGVKTRLKNHEPVQYILNEAWFYNIPFFVDPNVLIPRPETEELVDWLVKENQNKKNLVILDIGTGSGCIPITIKKKLQTAIVYSCDISESALQVAQRNASTHQASIRFVHLDFLEEANWQQFPLIDIIISNPPYVPEQDKTSMDKNVLKHEPSMALFVPDADPLIFYKKIAKAASLLLKPDGAVFLEIHENYGAPIVTLLRKYAMLPLVKKDMQGKDRMIKSINPPIG